MGKLLLLFVVVPAVELALLIKLGGLIGFLPTIAIIVLTGSLGATLARREGLGVLARMQQEVAAGGLPGGAIIDGVIILVAGALLITPGFMTDIAGFMCLIPGVRTVLKNFARRRLEKAVREGRVSVFAQFGPGTSWRRNDRGDGNIEM